MTSRKELIEAKAILQAAAKAILDAAGVLPSAEHERRPIYDGNEHVCVTCPKNSYGEYVAWDQAHPQGEPSDAAVRVMARHMAQASLDWIDIEGGGHEHDLECTNWQAYVDDSRAALRAAAEAERGKNRG